MIEISILSHENGKQGVPEHYGSYETSEEAIAALQKLIEEDKIPDQHTITWRTT